MSQTMIHISGGVWSEAWLLVFLALESGANEFSFNDSTRGFHCLEWIYFGCSGQLWPRDTLADHIVMIDVSDLQLLVSY